MPIAMSAVIVIPDMLDDTARLRRLHNRLVKRALVDVMMFHHKKHIPDHFNRWRQKKYGYAQRWHTTIARKRGRDMADLVRTGKTKRRMQDRMEVSVGGTAVGGDMRAKGRMKFKQGFRPSRAGSKGVTSKLMKQEIAAWTERELAQAAELLNRLVAESYRDEISNRPKLRKSIGDKVEAMLR